MNFLKLLAFFSLMFIACNNENPAAINGKVLGTWYFKDDATSYMEIDSTSYKEYVGGRIDSQIICKTHWSDSSHFSLEVKEADGFFLRTLKKGQRFDVTIVSVTPTELRLSVKGNVRAAYRNK